MRWRRTASYPGHIRIIGGRWRSRRLPVLASEGLRPTPDRIRETVFNWLAPYIAGARCLDLFAGTGALCLEALSRGASEVVMVERSPEALRQLRANIDVLGAAGAEAVGLDAFSYLHGHPRAFDIVFLDPPFATAVEMIRDCSELLGAGWIRPGGLVYVEAPTTLSDLPLPAGWSSRKKGAAGQVSYQLFQVSPAPG
jgi:16S rRNA (guanine966-N2)-methyltransferase